MENAHGHARGNVDGNAAVETRHVGHAFALAPAFALALLLPSRDGRQYAGFTADYSAAMAAYSLMECDHD
jgi:hypothetical protein